MLTRARSDAPGAFQLERHDSIEALASEWEELAERIDAAPWGRPEWFSIWADSFGASWRVVAGRRDGALIGVIPLVEHRGALQSASNWHTPAFGFVAEPADVLLLAEGLLAEPASRVSLGFVDADDPAIAAIERAAVAAKARVLVRALERSPFVPVDGSWEDYEGSLDGKVRRELRRRRRGLEAAGQFSFQVYDGRESLPGLLDEGLAVEAAGWKGERGSAVLSQPATESFYRTLAAWAAARGWLRLGFLRVDSRAIGFDFAVEHGGVHYLLKTGFDPAYRRFAPGMIIRLLMLERAFSAPLERYEFLGDADAWKLVWTQAVRERLLVQAFKKSVPGTGAWLAYAYGRPAAKRVLALAGR